MNKYLIALIILITGIFSLFTSITALNFNGLFRDDLYFIEDGSGLSYGNSLESRFLLRKKYDNWKFYGDLRLYVYSGLLASALPDPVFEPMRLYVRFSTGLGTFTFGRTHIAVGIMGAFNPFDTNKVVNFADVTYDRKGIDGVIWDLPLGDLSGVRAWLAPSIKVEDGSGGIAFHTNILNTDAGLVLSRLGPDLNLGGVYFKGDLFFTLSGGLAQHFDDNWSRDFLEANLTLERFFGTVFTQVSYYYNEKGAGEKTSYSMGFPDAYNVAKHYLYLNLSWNYDEFLGFYIYSFVNGVDGSTISVPGINYTINNGLTATLNFFFLTGGQNDEYSSSLMGKYGILLRFEAKL